MFRTFYAQSDSTLYQSAAAYNVGLDEILEVGKRLDTDGSTLLKSRSVVKFDMTEISASLSKYSKTVNDCKFMMQLFTSHAKNLPSDYNIHAKLVAQNWINGTGFESDQTIDGVSWTYPISASSWYSSSQNIQIGSSTLYATGTGAGGSYMSQSAATGSTSGLVVSESFSYRTTDINMNVTDSIKVWLSGSDGASIPNYGFLLQFSDTDEANEAVTGYVRFFSRDTHTIYVPKITMYWDDSTYTSGSMSPINLDSFSTYTRVKPAYKDTEVAKIRVFARDRYPQKQPNNLFPFETIKALPPATYYSVIDALTNETIIPYDDIYTKVSCDNTSNYIYIDMNGFMPERYYRLQFKIKDGFTEQFVDDDVYFKVVR